MASGFLNRTVSMINKYFDGQIPAYVEGNRLWQWTAQVAEQSIDNYHTYMEAVDHPRALGYSSDFTMY